jgi:hypothetical protein
MDRSISSRKAANRAKSAQARIASAILNQQMKRFREMLVRNGRSKKTIDLDANIILYGMGLQCLRLERSYSTCHPDSSGALR